MNNDAFRHIIRGILILIVQVLILKRVSAGSQWLWQHGDVFIYPLIILMLPLRMSRHYVTLLGFCVGLIIDMFYDTVGVHAFALTATAYARGLMLNFLEPRGGYTLSMSPTRHAMGINWLLIYTAILLFTHMFVFYVIEIFTFVYIGMILLKTLISFILSMITVTGYHLLFNPRR